MKTAMPPIRRRKPVRPSPHRLGSGFAVSGCCRHARADGCFRARSVRPSAAGGQTRRPRVEIRAAARYGRGVDGRTAEGHRSVETVVVGAGQAGLIMSHLLQKAGREHIVLERRTVLGGGWL